MIRNTTRERGKESVLVPTGHDPASVSCVRSLHRRGVNTIVASESETVPASASRFCDEKLSIPSPYEDLVAYKDALVGIMARPDVRTAIPIRPQDTYVFSKYRAEFDRYGTVVAPPFEMLRAVHDRVLLSEAAEEAGVPVPTTRLLSDVDDLDSEAIVKSRYNVLADEYFESYDPAKYRTAKDVMHFGAGEAPDRDEVTEEMGHDPIVQEYVPASDEYVFGALYDRGEALATFQHRQIRGDSYTGGGGVYRESVDIPELEDVGRTLLDHLDWHGLACIEYMEHDETGEFVLTEINPRMWQSLPSAVTAGADFPYYYWQQATGDADLIDAEYDLGVGSHFLYGEFEHLLSILQNDSPLVEKPSLSGTIRDILSSCLAMPYFDYLRPTDPGPFLTGVRQVFTRSK
jgi:predicted ATP-grasp superfamily ATP-dependent carboligase